MIFEQSSSLSKSQLNIKLLQPVLDIPFSNEF